MLQEIITYMIIGSAFTLALIKLYNRFGKKKKKKSVDYNNVKISDEHNCADCSAECMLRDAIQINNQAKNNEDSCEKINVKLN